MSTGSSARYIFIADGKASIALQFTVAINARANAASTTGSAPRRTNPPGNVTLNPDSAGPAVGNRTSANRTGPADTRPTCRSPPFFAHEANVGYRKPSRRANAAIDSPLAAYSAKSSARRSFEVIRRPSPPRFVSSGSNSVVIVFITPILPGLRTLAYVAPDRTLTLEHGITPRSVKRHAQGSLRVYDGSGREANEDDISAVAEGGEEDVAAVI
ncbi:MAG: hypothetical protein ABII82_07380, partial [Verrucomicrobiota bacterium]